MQNLDIQNLQVNPARVGDVTWHESAPAQAKPDAESSLRPIGTDVALSLLDDKWTIYVFKALQAGHNRYGAMLRYLPEITRKMLTQTLRKMERDGLIHRVDYGEKPARVEYFVTTAGQALLDRLCGLCDWTRAFMADVEAARRRYDAAT